MPSATLSGRRIGVIGPQYPDSFAEVIATAARSCGADVVELGSAVPRSTSRTWGRILAVPAAAPALVRRWQDRIARRAVSLDLVLTVEPTLTPRSVTALRQQGTDVALWFPDHVANLGNLLPFLTAYSMLCFKEPHVVERAAALLESPVRLLPEGCDPAAHRPPVPEPAHVPVIVVAGNMNGWRVALLERLSAAGVPLRLYGPPAPAWVRGASSLTFPSEYLSGARKASVFRGAAGVLNNLHPAEVRGVNARLFEATACGAVTISENRPELAKMFRPGSEVLSFDTFEELLDQCRWAVEHPEEGRAIGDAAALRAHGEHTVQHRLATLVGWLHS